MPGKHSLISGNKSVVELGRRGKAVRRSLPLERRRLVRPGHLDVVTYGGVGGGERGVARSLGEVLR